MPSLLYASPVVLDDADQFPQVSRVESVIVGDPNFRDEPELGFVFSL
jgi:hypothetical protein